MPLLLVANATTNKAPASADVGAPSWWNGDCDANHWNAAAADFGWRGAGAHRLGASFDGVPVCGPRRSVDGAPDVQWLRPGWGHLEWECTELAFRFMAQIYGVTAYSANGDSVVANYRPSYGGGLQTVSNGTVGRAPTPGDVMSFNMPGGFGHVAVVTASAVDALGNGVLTLMSQNDTFNGWRTLYVSNWTVIGFGAYYPTAWLHDPFGRPSVLQWYLRNSDTPGPPDLAFPYGTPGDTPVAGDWNNGPVDGVGVFRDGNWYLRNSASPGPPDVAFAYGAAGYVPVVGRWNPSATGIGVFFNGNWYLRPSVSPGAPTAAFAYGSPGDIPVVGDWNNDGIDTIGVYENGTWYLRNSNTPGPPDIVVSYGTTGYVPLTGVWQGNNGGTSLGVFFGGTWALRTCGPQGCVTPGPPTILFNYGGPGNIPVRGNWNAGNIHGIGVVVPT